MSKESCPECIDVSSFCSCGGSGSFLRFWRLARCILCYICDDQQRNVLFVRLEIFFPFFNCEIMICFGSQSS